MYSLFSFYQRRNLGSIAKVLQHAAACKLVSCVFENCTVPFFDIHGLATSEVNKDQLVISGPNLLDTYISIILLQFEGENIALSSLNPYIKESFGRFRYFLSSAPEFL